MKKLGLLFILIGTLVLVGCSKPYSGGFTYKILDLSSYELETGYAIAFPKGSEYKTEFNKVISKMMEDGTLACFNNFYFNGDDCYQNIDFINQVYEIDYDGKGKTLDIITSSGYEPFEVLDDKGKLAGYDIDLANFIAKELNLKLNWHDGSFTQVLLELESGKMDLAIAAITPTLERQKNVDFSINYYSESNTVLLFPANKSYNSLADLKGLTFAAQAGTVQAELILQLQNDGVIKKAMDVDYPATAIQAMKSNKIAGLFVEQSVAEEILKKFN